MQVLRLERPPRWRASAGAWFGATGTTTCEAPWKSVSVAGRGVGQIRGKSAHATESRKRWPAGTRYAVARSGTVTR